MNPPASDAFPPAPAIADSADQPQPPRRRKLIEVALPLEAINGASATEKSIRHGHPSTLHLWWARRPLAACRAVLFAQLVDDPSAWPEHFPDEAAQKAERERLHKLIEKLVPWAATRDKTILRQARWEIARSLAWGRGEEPPALEDGQGVLAYLQEHAPPVYDPFCGGGSIPLEAQRLGLRAYGSDLNPVAVLISKALVEIPPRFANRPPVHPGADPLRHWEGAQGLAADVRYYGQWMRDQAFERLGHLYPKARLPDGQEATVIAWLWARTVASPDPGTGGAHVPLVSSFMLSTKKDRKAWLRIIQDPKARDGWRFAVETGPLSAEEENELKKGTKAGRGANFFCSLTGTAIPGAHIKAEGKAGRLGARMMAIVAENKRQRLFLDPDPAHEKLVESIEKPDIPEICQSLDNDPRAIWAPLYGLDTFDKLFSYRQLFALNTYSDLISEARDKIFSDCASATFSEDNHSLVDDGAGKNAYVDAIVTYLAIGLSRLTDIYNTLCRWESSKTQVRNLFTRQAIPMLWDYAEPNVFGEAAGDFVVSLGNLAKVIERSDPSSPGYCKQVDAPKNNYDPVPVIISTDPPYYDNVGYAALFDFFYVWLRRSLRSVWPELFRRLLAPKDPELIVSPYRHENKETSENLFMDGMKSALRAIWHASTNNVPITIYYAFKQSEVDREGVTSPGWSSFLQAVIESGYVVDGTWPMRTELEYRMLGRTSNALASSIVLVCVKRPEDAPLGSRREFRERLKAEMPVALQRLKEAGVGPVDMAQAALGPGMGIFSSYRRVLETDDTPMSVRTALALINTTREEVLGEEDSQYDSATRFYLDWFQAFGLSEGKAGDAISMANAYGLALSELEGVGVFRAKAGKASLRPRSELPRPWQPSFPAADPESWPSFWRCTQQLIERLLAEDGGGEAAVRLLAQYPDEAIGATQDLAYRLYDICERKGWAQEAQAYNILAEDFPTLERRAIPLRSQTAPSQTNPQSSLDLGESAP